MTTATIHRNELLLKVDIALIRQLLRRVLIEECVVLSALKKQFRCLAIQPTIFGFERVFRAIEFVSLIEASLTLLTHALLLKIHVVIDCILDLTPEGDETGQVVYVVTLLYHSDELA